MAGSFTSPDGDIENIYITVYDLIDRYVTTGSLWTWGENTYGQLGTNNRTNYSSPVQTVSGGTNWKQSNHNGAIKTDGTLWMWGQNDYGGLGTNDVTHKSSPVQTVAGGTNWKQVHGSATMLAAIKTDGTLWTWGYGFYGQLGNNTSGSTAKVSSPIQTVSGGNNWKQVTTGQSTFAIKTDGTLWGWGRNDLGGLGTNNRTNYSSPVQTVSGGTNWKLVSSGGLYTTAIKTDGTLWLWGYNSYGQLGTNNITSYSSPVQTVSGGTNWKQVSNSNHTAAIKTDGTLWVWGNNNYGQLGTNEIANRSSPVQTVSGGTNWKQVSVGYYFSVAVKTDGTLWTWGRNYLGDLGSNNTTNRSSPIQTVAGGTNWKSVGIPFGSYNVRAIYFNDVGDLYPSA